MENLIIESTHNSPAVSFDISGNLKIRGRFIIENAVRTFDPMINWINEFEGSRVDFLIDLDYLNTSASMQLFGLIKLLDENCAINEVNVTWIYEEDDEDHLETGQFFEDRLKRTKFEYEMVIDRDVA